MDRRVEEGVGGIIWVYNNFTIYGILACRVSCKIKQQV